MINEITSYNYSILYQVRKLKHEYANHLLSLQHTVYHTVVRTLKLIPKVQFIKVYTKKIVANAS